jgi:hypothetical protein
MFDPLREHKSAHGQIDHRRGNFCSALVAAVEPTMASEPAKGANDNSAAGQDNEFGRRVRTLDNFQGTAPKGWRPSDQSCRIAAVGPDALDASKDGQQNAYSGIEVCAAKHKLTLKRNFRRFKTGSF